MLSVGVIFIGAFLFLFQCSLLCFGIVLNKAILPLMLVTCLIHQSHEQINIKSSLDSWPTVRVLTCNNNQTSLFTVFRTGS